VNADGREGLQVGLDSGATARVAAGDREGCPHPPTDWDPILKGDEAASGLDR
jgi:hypothetical protein